MVDFNINVKKPVARVVSGDQVDFVWVPEPLEKVQEREFRRRVNKEIKTRLPQLIQKKINELQPNLHKEKEAEYQRGYKDGEEVGRQAEQERLKELYENFAAAIKEAVEFKKQLLKEAEVTIVNMAFNFARRIVGEEIKTKEKVLQNHVKKLLDYVIGESRLIFHVHPDDVHQFDEKHKFIPEEYLNAIEIIPDEKITRGGCILETNSGIIDGTIETRIAELESAVINGLEHEIEPDTGETD